MIPFLNKKIFLTRTEEDNSNFQKCFNLLKPKYYPNEVFVSVPLLDIFFVNIKELYIQETNLIFTSRYGIKAISELENLKLKKTYCVGKSTAEIATKLGFSKFSLLYVRLFPLFSTNSPPASLKIRSAAHVSHSIVGPNLG